MMKFGKNNIIALIVMAAAILCQPQVVAEPELLKLRRVALTVAGAEHQVHIPNGYRLEVLTEDLDGPRLLSFSEDGEMFIGSKSGHVYRLKPPYRKPESLIRLEGYTHSVAWRQGELLIARTDGLL